MTSASSDSALFASSIESNILYGQTPKEGKEGSWYEVHEAARMVDIDEVIEVS